MFSLPERSDEFAAQKIDRSRSAAIYGQLRYSCVQEDLFAPRFEIRVRADGSVVNKASYATGGSFSPADNRGFTTVMAALPV